MRGIWKHYAVASEKDATHYKEELRNGITVTVIFKPLFPKKKFKSAYFF